MPGLIHDVDVSAQIKEQLPEFIRADAGQNFQGFLEAYYEWLELVRIDLDRDVSELFYVDQIVYGERSAAQAVIKSVINEGRTIYVQYKSRQKMLYDERIFTEGLSWDDLVEEHKDRFDVEFWLKSPGDDYTAGILDVHYNAILAASYMMDLQDVDTTDLKYFNETYRDTLLANFPELENARYVNERQLAKMIRTFNNKKGVDKTIQWLFKLVYGEDSDVFFPGTLLLRASDGRWNQPIVTFLAGIPQGFTLSDFVGMRIRGKESNVEALVINSYKNQVGNKEVNVLELAGLPDWVDETQPGLPGNPSISDFTVGETIEVLPATFIEAEDFYSREESSLTAEVRGGVKEVDIYAAGSHYKPGQVVTFESAGGVTSTAEIIKTSNNFAIDFMGVVKQGTGYQVGDEVEVFPAFTGGRNELAIVGELADPYIQYHSYQQILPYVNFNLNANSIFFYNTREAVNTALYFTITLPQVFANGEALYQNGTPYPDYPIVKGQNITFTHSGGTENALVIAQEENKNSMLRIRLYDTALGDPSGIKSLHPIHTISEFTTEDGTVIDRVDDTVLGGSVTANVQFKDVRIEDALVYSFETFGGIESIKILSTGKEFFDLPSALVKGRSNTAVYPTWTANTELEVDYGGDGGKYSISAYNTMQITTDESTMVFANGWDKTYPDYPISRVAAMESVRTTDTPGGMKTYVHGLAAFGEIRAELVGVLDLASISYFVQEDYFEASEDDFYFIMEDDPDEEDRMLAEGDSVVVKVLFEEDVADPFLPNQTLTVRDENGTALLQFDGILIEDFIKQGTDGRINVPYLATNSIFQMLVKDPGSDFSQDFLPDSDVITFGGLNANLIPILSGTITYEGEWKGYNGMLSSPQVIQDSYYWQDYSYSIRSGFEISVYRDLVKRLLHVAGEQLFGEMIITMNVNAMLYSGGDYGGKYDNNYLIDANSHTSGPFGGPFMDRPFFNLEREFLFTAANGAVAPYATSPWQSNTEDQYADLDGRLQDLTILHEPILHDGLFHANGQPVTWVITPGKTYNNPTLNEQMDRFITEDAVLRPEGLLMEDQFQTSGPDYIFAEFPDAVAYKQFMHGARVDWKEFRYLRDLGEIVWIDQSLNDVRGGFYYQVPDDTAEGAYYRVDLEGNNLLTEVEKDNLITEDSAQDLTFAEATYTGLTGNSVTLVATQSNSSDFVVEGVDFDTSSLTGVRVGQKFQIEFDGFEPQFQHSGYSFSVDDGIDELDVLVEPSYEELRGQMLSPSVFQSPFTHKTIYDGSATQYYFAGGDAAQAGFDASTPTGVDYYIQKSTGEVGIYTLVSRVSSTRYNVQYVSGDVITTGNIRRGDQVIYEGRVNLTDTSGTEINRATFTAEINEIGLVDTNSENLSVDSGGTPSFSNLSVYKFNREGSTSNYYVEHQSGPVLDWGGPTDIYGGTHNAIIRQSIPQVLEFDGFDFPADTLITISDSDTSATINQDTFLGRDLGGQTAMDVFPGYNYGTFEYNGVSYDTNIRYRGNGAGIWNTVAAGLQPGDYLHAQYVGHSSSGTAMVVHIDYSSQIIYMVGGMVSWSQHSYTDKDLSKREILPVESLPLPNPAVYIAKPLGSGRHEMEYVAGQIIDFGGPTDRFNSGFETTISYYEGNSPTETVQLKDQDGNLYTGPEIPKLTISDVVPKEYSGESNGIMTVSQNSDGPGNFYRFDNMDSTGFQIGDIAVIRGKLATGQELAFKGEVSGLSSLTIKLPETTFVPGGIYTGDHTYINASASIMGLSPANTGVLDHLNIDFVYSEYQITPTGTNNEYIATHLAGTVLNFGGDNNIYDAFIANAIYLDGDAGVAEYNFTHYGPFDAEMTDTSPPTFHVDEDVSGAFITRNASFFREEISLTFGGQISAPFYLKIEDTTPGAVWNPIDFNYKYWALDGRIYAEFQNEIDQELPVDVTTWNFYNPLYDVEKHPSDYDGTVYRDWRDNLTSIPEPYRVRYDKVLAELPDFNDFVLFAEHQNQDATGNVQLVFEDSSNILQETFSADWQQAEANGSVHTHRDWFAFSEPTISYHQKDFVNTQIPEVSHIVSDMLPEFFPLLNMQATYSMNVEIEVRGDTVWEPTEFQLLPVHVASDEGWLNPEYIRPLDMEMLAVTDLGDFNIETEEVAITPSTVDVDLVTLVGVDSTAIRLPLGRGCGLLIQESASFKSRALYERLIMLPEEYKATYYPPQLSANTTEFVVVGEEQVFLTMEYAQNHDIMTLEDGGNVLMEQLVTFEEDLIYEDGGRVTGEQFEWEETAYEPTGGEYLVEGERIIAEDFTTYGNGAPGFFGSRSVDERIGYEVDYLAFDEDCGDIPIEYHKEIYMYYDASATFTAFRPTYSPRLEFQVDPQDVSVTLNYDPEIEISEFFYVPPTVTYVVQDNRVMDHSIIPYHLESDDDTFGWHMESEEDGIYLTFEDNGYILSEQIPEAVRNIRYNWELVDRQFSEYGYGSDLSRNMRGYSVTRDFGDFVRHLDEIDPMIATVTQWQPQGQTEDQTIPYYFLMENGDNIIYEDGGYMFDEEAAKYFTGYHEFPRQIETELIANLMMTLPFNFEPANTEIIVPPQVSVSLVEPEVEIPPYVYDVPFAFEVLHELDLAEVQVSTIWYNYPQSPATRYYDDNSDLRAVLTGDRPVIDGPDQPEDIGVAIIKTLDEYMLKFEFIVEYNTATIYTYYEPVLRLPEHDLEVRAVDEPIEVEHFLFVPYIEHKVIPSTDNPEYETELDITLPLDVTNIVLPIHEEHDPVIVGDLIGGSEYAQPSIDHYIPIDVAALIQGETGQAPELLGFITQVPSILVDLSFDTLIFDYDIVAVADVFPYSAVDRGPNSFGLTPYENIWTPVGDTVWTQRRDDTNGVRINTYDSYPVAKQQDSDFAAANNSWSVTTMFNIETMTGLFDGQVRGNQNQSKWDPMWIWSQANDNEGPGFRFGINNRFMVFAYGQPDASNTFITRLQLDPTQSNFNQKYRTRINEWYSITITYNGKYCGDGINQFRQDDANTEWTEGTDDPQNNQFRFYLTELETGETTELSTSAHPLTVNAVTTAVPEGFTVGASGPETLRSSSNTGSFSSFYEHNLKVAMVATHNRTLSIREIQGTYPENRSGFALDPMGWKYTEDSSFVFVDDLGNIALEGVRDKNLRRVTANTTQIWMFGNGRNDGFVQQNILGLHSGVPDNLLVDNTVMNPYGLFLHGENTTHYTTGTTFGLGKETPDFGDAYQLFAGDVSTIEIDRDAPLVDCTFTANGGYTFNAQRSSVKDEYDFTHTGLTIDVTNLVPFQFLPEEIAPVIQFNIFATGDQFHGGNSALNNSNSQIVSSIDYDWTFYATDIHRHVIDVEALNLQLTEIPLSTQIFEISANTLTADPGGSIISDITAPGQGSGSSANLGFAIATTDSMRHFEMSPVIIQYGRDRIITQGDDVRLHGLIVEEPLQFILAEEDDTPIIAEQYTGEAGLQTETSVDLLAEGTYDAMILDSELGGEPFFLQSEDGFDLDLELFEEYGDSIIAGYDNLHDYVLTERYDTVQNDDWILTQNGHTIVAEEPIRASDSEIILDSISNPRTIADIPFDDFIRFDTHDGVSTLD